MRSQAHALKSNGPRPPQPPATSKRSRINSLTGAVAGTLLILIASGCASILPQTTPTPPPRTIAVPAETVPHKLRKGDPSPLDGWLVPTPLFNELLPCFRDELLNGGHTPPPSPPPAKPTTSNRIETRQTIDRQQVEKIAAVSLSKPIARLPAVEARISACGDRLGPGLTVYGVDVAGRPLTALGPSYLSLGEPVVLERRGKAWTVRPLRLDESEPLQAPAPE